MKIKIEPTGTPPGQLATAEIHFTDQDGILSGLKLIGFGIWERRTGGGRNVTFPARQYSVNGERRSFALLRPTSGHTIDAQEPIRQAILNAYEAHEANPDATSGNLYQVPAIPQVPQAIPATTEVK